MVTRLLKTVREESSVIYANSPSRWDRRDPFSTACPVPGLRLVSTLVLFLPVGRNINKSQIP